MRIKSLTAAALGLCVAILLAGCYTSYVDPITGGSRGTPPSQAEIASANSNPNSFVRANPGFDFASIHTWTTDANGNRLNNIPDGANPPGSSPSTTSPPASAVSPTGTPGVSAAGAAATTGPMISSPPPPPPPTPSPSPRIY